MKATLCLFLLLIPAALYAQSSFVEIESLEDVTIRDDRAYIMFRTVRPRGVPSIEPVFLRIPRPGELGRLGDIENVQSVDASGSLVELSSERLYLVEVPPGDYVLYGATYAGGTPHLYVCMCLGTVGFAAAVGEITDMGYFLADRVHETSVIPELAPESGFGPSSYGMTILLGATVRPARTDTHFPAGIDPGLINPANYSAIGRFFEPRALAINRLAPVPGILDYELGRVIDVSSGQPVPDVR